jgi:NADPH:quinone reductase-like Zn-dependent oxidoreductase
MRGFITDPTAPGGLRLAGDLEEPVPEANELVLDVRAFSVNRGELFLLQQRAEGWRPGQDVAGVVLQAAADGNGPPVGARVVAIVDGAGWSERVAVRSNHVAEFPDTVTFEVAASLPIAGLTALRALRVDGTVIGRRVLVTGATGGVGQFAIQLGVAAGATVTALVNRDDQQELARNLGAHHVVTALDDDVGPFELVLEGVGGHVLQASVHRLTPGGTVATYGTLAGPAQLSVLDFRSAPQGKVVGFFHAYPQEEKGADLAQLAAFVASGRLKPLISLVRPWTQIQEVLQAMLDHKVPGKAVLIRT